MTSSTKKESTTNRLEVPSLKQAAEAPLQFAASTVATAVAALSATMSARKPVFEAAANFSASAEENVKVPTGNSCIYGSTGFFVKAV